MKSLVFATFSALMLSACWEPRLIAPELTPSSSINGSTVTVSVTARNTTSGSIRFTIYSPCTVVLQVYDNAARTGTPRWESSWASLGCKGFTMESNLDAHESFTWSASAEMSDLNSSIFGARPPLAAGPYYLAARFALIEPYKTTVPFPAGELEIRP